MARSRGALEDPEVTRLRSALLAGVPADAAERTEEQQARALLADLLEWHRREAKPAWWRYFYVRTLSAELVGEPDALGGLTGGEIVGQVKRSVVRGSRSRRRSTSSRPGIRRVDPSTGRGWTVWARGRRAGTIDLKVGRTTRAAARGAGRGRPGQHQVLAERLRDLGDRVVREGVTRR